MTNDNVEGEIALAQRTCKGVVGDILVCGLGLGYTSRAAVAVQESGRVITVEQDQDVIDFMAGYREPVIKEDAYHLLANTEDKYKVVLVDVDNYPKLVWPENEVLYKPEGMKLIQSRLDSFGKVGYWLISEDTEFIASMGEIYPKVDVYNFSTGAVVVVGKMEK